jgi:hypothetical protein
VYSAYCVSTCSNFDLKKAVTNISKSAAISENPIYNVEAKLMFHLNIQDMHEQKLILLPFTDRQRWTNVARLPVSKKHTEDNVSRKKK